jgi:hypothetical protein
LSPPPFPKQDEIYKRCLVLRPCGGTWYCNLPACITCHL